jgi:hypothetical protein
MRGVCGLTATMRGLGGVGLGASDTCVLSGQARLPSMPAGRCTERGLAAGAGVYFDGRT